MKPTLNGIMETPIYGVAEAAQYLRVPQNTLAYWLKGGSCVAPHIKVASTEPVIRKIKINDNVNGGGQECPPYTIPVLREGSTPRNP
jgi:hypothetical protein